MRDLWDVGLGRPRACRRDEGRREGLPQPLAAGRRTRPGRVRGGSTRGGIGALRPPSRGEPEPGTGLVEPGQGPRQARSHEEAAESLAKAAELNPAREEQYRLDVQNILRSKEDASVIAPQWKQPAPTAAPKVVDTHLIEALEHYDSLLRADPSLVVAWRTKAEILERLERPEEARAAGEEADRRERDDRFVRAAVTGLQSNGLANPGPTGD